MKKSSIFLGYIIFTALNCTSVSEQDLITDTQPIINTTYTDNIKAIIDNNCIICHSNPPENGAPMPLLTYENVKEAVENRNLISRISATNLSFLMPLGGPRLPQNLIDTVMQWEEEGLLE